MKPGALIVASASPRRRALLRQAGYVFEVEPSDADETLSEPCAPEEAVRLLAERKARAVSQKHPGAVVLGCDTVVTLAGSILGKPKDAAQAAEMLRALSGRTHTVCSGVCITDGERTERFVCATDVTFYPLGEATVRAYVATGEPFDKAGGYGIQGYGAVLVRELRGDYFNVVGLPLAQCARVLAGFGVYGTVTLP